MAKVGAPTFIEYEPGCWCWLPSEQELYPEEWGYVDRGEDLSDEDYYGLVAEMAYHSLEEAVEEYAEFGHDAPSRDEVEAFSRAKAR